MHPGGAALSSRVLDLLDPQPGMRVLEIGCGTGASLVRLGALARVECVGIDLLPEMLAVARWRLRLAGVPRRLLRADVARGLPFRSGAFQRAFAESVFGFQHEDAARSMLAELWRVLAPGGRAVVSEGVWRNGVSAEQAAALHTAHLRDFGVSFASPQPWSADDWRSEMRRAGFDVREERAGVIDDPPRRPLSRARLASAALTHAGRWSQLVRPSHFAALRRYHRQQRQYAPGELPMDVVVFVLGKP